MYRQVSVRRWIFSACHGLLASCFVTAVAAAAEPEHRQVGLQIVPGTRYKVYALYEDGKYMNCKASTETREALLTFSILQKGSFHVTLNDPYQQRAVSESLGWKEGNVYSGQVFVEKKMWSVDFEAADPSLFSFKPNKQFVESLQGAKVMAIQIGNISMRGGYDIQGFSTIYSYLRSCYREHGPR